MWKTGFLVATGLVPLLGLLADPPDVMTLVYTLFVVAFLLRKQVQAVYHRLPGARVLKVAVLFLLAGALTETLAWLNNYLKAAEEPALFHPQLLADLIIGIGFYGGWAAAWLFALKWFRFSVKEAFLVTGVQGIFFEQLGAVFLAMLTVLRTNPAAAAFFGIYVFLVHGSAVALAIIPIEVEADSTKRSGHWTRFPIVIALMVSLAFAGCAIVGLVAELFGGLPPKRSIVEHPFW
jgi:hypothetical protein